MQRVESGNPVHLTASGAVSVSGGALLGFYVGSTNAGTIVIRDGSTSGATALTGTITPAAGAFHRLALACPNGCYATIGGTALDVTLFFAAG